MRFQTRQVLEIADISGDTLRNWKKNLPPISSVDGRSVQYTPGQLVGICAVAAVVKNIGLPISRLAPEAEVIFDSIERYTLERARNISMIITATKLYFDVDNSPVTDATFIIVKLNPIWDQIQNAFLEADPRDIAQATMQFAQVEDEAP